MTTFPNTRTQTIDWVNEHGTFKKNGVERILPIASAGDDLARWRRVGDVVNAVVTHAFKQGEPLRTDGSRWSLSAIGVPSQLALSLAAHDALAQVPASWLGSAYASDLASRNLTPMLISGSMKIHRINRLLTMRDLALQTTGTSDGQTLAGAIATGTHGAAIQLGAIHDTVRAVHLMIGPGQALLIQPESKPLKQQAAASLTSWLGFSTLLVTDDALFDAACVHLGSLGIVLNLVVEAEPLYYLTSVTTPHVDAKWKDVLRLKTPAGIAGHSPNPFHLQVLLSVYEQSPKSAPRAWVRTMHKHPYQDEPFVVTEPGNPDLPDPDLLGFLAPLANIIDLPTGFARTATAQLIERYGDKKSVHHALPGAMFGPTSLPRGQGHSAELVVDAANALPAAEAMLAAFDDELKRGRQHFGAMGCRFVGGSRASLAPNTKSPSCFIEVPTVRTKESEQIYEACGKKLAARGIPFGCHWGQYLTQTKGSLVNYWKPAQRDAWVAARRRLLKTSKAREVFASVILKGAGLGG